MIYESDFLYSFIPEINNSMFNWIRILLQFKRLFTLQLILPLSVNIYKWIAISILDTIEEDLNNIHNSSSICIIDNEWNIKLVTYKIYILGKFK